MRQWLAMEGDIGQALNAITSQALRERLSEAVYQVLNDAIATDPQLAAAAYLHRGLLALARDDRDAAIGDLQAAVASDDGPAVYWAARHLIQLHENFSPLLSFLRGGSVDVMRRARERKGPEGSNSTSMQQMRDWVMRSGDLALQPSPYAILAWLHSHRSYSPGLRTPGLRTLELFYAAAVELGYCTQDPMPQVNQLLAVASVSTPESRPSALELFR